MQQLPLPGIDEMMLKESGRVKAIRGYSGTGNGGYVTFELDMGAELTVESKQREHPKGSHRYRFSGLPAFIRHIRTGDRVTIVFLKEPDCRTFSTAEEEYD